MFHLSRPFWSTITLDDCGTLNSRSYPTIDLQNRSQCMWGPVFFLFELFFPLSFSSFSPHFFPERLCHANHEKNTTMADLHIHWNVPDPRKLLEFRSQMWQGRCILEFSTFSKGTVSNVINPDSFCCCFFFSMLRVGLATLLTSSESTPLSKQILSFFLHGQSLCVN